MTKVDDGDESGSGLYELILADRYRSKYSQPVRSLSFSTSHMVAYGGLQDECIKIEYLCNTFIIFYCFQSFQKSVTINRPS